MMISKVNIPFLQNLKFNLSKPEKKVEEIPALTYKYVERMNGDRGIHCFKCGLTSWNINDVNYRYCGNCNIFHELTRVENEIDRLANDIETKWQEKTKPVRQLYMLEIGIILLGFITWLLIAPWIDTKNFIEVVLVRIVVSVGFSMAATFAIFYLWEQIKKTKEKIND